MGWAKFDDGFTDHPKVRAVGPMAELLAMRAVIFAARYETDGFIRASSLDQLTHGIPTAKKQISSLIREKLWEETDGGWLIHDYLEYHPSKAELESKRQAARERMKNVRENKTRTSQEPAETVRKKFALPRPDPTPVEAKASTSAKFSAFNARRAVEAVRERQDKGLPVKSPNGLARTIAGDAEFVAESQRLYAHRDCDKCDGKGFQVFHPQAGGSTQAPCTAEVV